MKLLNTGQGAKEAVLMVISGNLECKGAYLGGGEGIVNQQGVNVVKCKDICWLLSLH